MTSTVRSVRVVMEADVAGYIAAIRAAGHETDASFSNIDQRTASASKGLKEVDTSAAGMGRSVGSARKDVQGLDQDLKKVEKSSGKASKQLDTFSGRLGVIVTTIAGLGPALIPLSAGVLPAISGGITGIGAAGAGLGVAILALHGLKDGIKALDAYKLDPTIENLQKLRVEEEKLGPAGAQFVQYLDQLEPKLEGLQRVARAGWFPGLEIGINDLLQRLPMVRGIVKSVSEELGVLSVDAGKSLSSSEWRPFFQYVRSQAAPILDAFAHSAGNVALGLANMLVAFGPASSGFATGLEADTQRFANWSKSLDQNQGFQHFLAYIHQEGPQALHLLTALMGAVGGLVKAATPWGTLLLPILTDVLKVFTAIASSPVGPALYSTAAAMLLYSKAAGVASAANKRFEASNKGVVSSASSARVAALRVASGLGLLALGSTDAAHHIGLANTAMDTGAGLIIGGPWGAAVGFAVGAYQDLAAASDRAASSAHDLQTLMADSPTAFGAQAAGIETVVKKAAALRAEFDSGSRSNETNLSYWDDLGRQILHGVGLPVQTVTDQMDAAATKAEADAQRMMVAVATIARGTGDTSVPTPQDLTQGRAGFVDTTTGPKVDTASMDALEAAATRLQPTLSALGISFNDLGKQTPAQLKATGAAIQAYNSQADSARGKNQALATAFTGLDSALYSTQSSASAVKDALDALLSPKLNLSAATDAWATALQQLNADLDKSNKSIEGNSAAALKNRSAIRDRVSALTDMLGAEADAGAGSGKLTRTLQASRQALIQQATQAGVSKSAMVAYLDQLGLTPKLVKTLIEAQTGQAQSAIDKIIASIASIHGKTAYIDIVTRRTGAGGQGGGYSPSADGSTVPKGGPYVDRHLYLLAPGEEVISDRHGQATRNRPLLKAINAGRAADGITVADGGPVDTTSTADTKKKKPPQHSIPVTFFDVDAYSTLVDHILATAKGMNTLKGEMAGFQKVVDQLKQAYTKEKQKLTELTTARDTTASTVATSLIHDPFGNGLAGLDAQVGADTGDITAMTAALATLVRNGLDPKSALYQQLAASDDVTTAQQLAALSSTDLASRATAFQAVQSQAAALGSTVGNQAYADAIRQQTATDRELLHEIKSLNYEISLMGKHVHDGAKAGSQAGSQAGSKAGSEAGAAAGTQRGMDARTRHAATLVRAGR